VAPAPIPSHAVAPSSMPTSSLTLPIALESKRLLLVKDALRQYKHSLIFCFYFFLFFLNLSLKSANVDVLRIVAGEHSLSQDSGLEQNRNVVSYTIHENYDA
jgi:hypothetical protein